MTPPPDDEPQNPWLQLARMRTERGDAYRKMDALRKGLIQYEHTLTAVEAERDEVRAVLREVQWSGSCQGEYDVFCPICYGRKETTGHAEDCALGRVLEGRDE